MPVCLLLMFNFGFSIWIMAVRSTRKGYMLGWSVLMARVPPRYLIRLGQAAAQVFVAQVDFLQTEISRG